MIRTCCAYLLMLGAMASIAYGCWLWNEGLGLVMGGCMIMATAVEIRGRA